MDKAEIVIGLGFGDEGKGATVDYLVRRCPKPVTVVRYNGGAQCAHNVVTPEGTHHTFQQFGSGTFQGAKTHLSKHVLVNPLLLVQEMQALRDKDVPCPENLLTIDKNALVTDMYQVAYNRVVSKGNRTSCGLGIGETIQAFIEHPDAAIRFGDLLHSNRLAEKLAFSRARCIDKLGLESSDDQNAIFGYSLSVGDIYRSIGEIYASRVVSDDYLHEQSDHLVFEGAQGALLDMDYGFFPYVTRTKITPVNAYDLLGAREATKIGVLRSYTTRHGAGPLPTEGSVAGPLSERHNLLNDFQGPWRTGAFDAVLARYAIDMVGGVDELALNHLDDLSNASLFCHTYEEFDKIELSKVMDLNRQAKTTARLFKVHPKYKSVEDRYVFPSLLETELHAPITICANGPTHRNRRPREKSEVF